MNRESQVKKKSDGVKKTKFDILDIVIGKLFLLMILLAAVWFYILMFIGCGNTYVDEVCYFSAIVCYVVMAVCRIVREYLLYKNEKEVY